MSNEALRLAEWCEAHSSGDYRPSAEAGAELRRLHAENEALRQENTELEAECRTLVRQNGEWQQQVESLRADAERYRWVRENSNEYSLTQEDGYGGRELMGWEALLDAAIDTARSKT